MHKSKLITAIAAGIIIITSTISAVSCGSGSVTQLPGSEVRQYQGQNLSSVNDFRENSIKGPQQIDISTYQLQVNGLVANSGNYTYDQVTSNFSNYKKIVELNCVEGWSVDILWQGVQVRDILALAKPLPTAKVVIFHAYDGYTTSFPIEYIMNNPILIAYKMNDITIPPERGYPFMLVAEMKWGYKWIKWITQIELSDNINYQGYWEQRGYSNSGDLDKGFLGNPPTGFPF
jgi:DMSO/TMAO reductase YedYZ molybdopterin-dependent catalytic subunit